MKKEVLYLQEHSVEITLQHPDDAFHLFGSNERHLRLMEEIANIVGVIYVEEIS